MNMWAWLEYDYLLTRQVLRLPCFKMDWKLAILEGLRLRNQRESGGFTELITSRECSVLFTAGIWLESEAIIYHQIFAHSDSKIQDQLETIRKEVTRLTYLKNELETVPQ